MATAKGQNSDLLAAMDEELLALKRSPESYYYEILNRWLGGADGAMIPRWVRIAGTITAAFVLFLRRQVKRATVEIERIRE
ncbi:MAG: hypothetical protein ACOCYB_10955, partial [Alkalispirochaeta sp.]